MRSSATVSGALDRNDSGESGPPAKADRSRPAEKDGPAPVTTTTRTASVNREPTCAKRGPGLRVLGVAHIRSVEGDGQHAVGEADSQPACDEQVWVEDGRRVGALAHFFFLVRVAPPRPRSVTSASTSSRCTKP